MLQVSGVAVESKRCWFQNRPLLRFSFILGDHLFKERTCSHWETKKKLRMMYRFVESGRETWRGILHNMICVVRSQSLLFTHTKVYHFFSVVILGGIIFYNFIFVLGRVVE